MENSGVVVGLKRVALMLSFVSIAVFNPFSALAAKNVTLAWDASTDSSVTSYKIYYGTATGNYPGAVTVGNVTTGTVSNLTEGATYYFAVKAANGSAESDFSNEISYTVPGTPTVNQPPTLNTIANVSINEDAGAQTVSLSGIGTGGESQTLVITASSSNTGLIPNPTVSYVSPNATGSLSFTPVANANGTATITVTVNDGQVTNNTIIRTFTVTVNAVNDAPTLNTLGNLTIAEDAAQQTVNLSGISAGAANESQTLTVSATSSNPSLIPNPTVNYTSPSTTGSLSFTPVTDANGTATITVTVNDGQVANNTIVRTFTVTVNSVNDAPKLDALSNVTINEDAGAQTVNLSGIGTGAANESQTLTITASSSNAGLIPNPTVSYISPGAVGSLTFTPVANANGTATITVTVNDGQAQNNTVVRTFTVTVNAVNDAPTLNTLSNLSIDENAAQQTVNLSGIGSGAANELQALVVTATSSNPALIPHPTVNYTSPNATGSLTFTPVADADGTATITVTVDDGQAQDSTIVRTFIVTVNSVNNAPTLNPIANVTINEDAGTQAVSLSGIGTGAANEFQTLTVTATSSNPSLVPNPTVTYTSPNATGSLAYTPVADANGTATITVTVNDGQAQNNTVVRIFTVTVNSVNDAPTLNALNNVSIAENAPQQTVSLVGIGTGAANESQTLAVAATSSNPSLIPNPTVSYTSPNATGSLSFTPVADANGTATITVTVNDGQAQNNTVVRTFTVTVNSVNNAPTLNSIANVTVNEDAGAQTVNLTGISSGAANETQTLTVAAISSNPSLIPNPAVTYSSPNSTGSLVFTPVTDANGAATITVTVNDGQAQNNTVVQTFTVTVTSVNDVPTLNALNNLSVADNAGLQTVNLSGIGSGATNESQTLAVTATSSNPSLIPNPTVNYSSPAATGSLNFTPVAGGSGTATITVTVDDGQAQNNTVVRTFTISVNAINNAPTLDTIANVTINEDASAQTVNLTGIGTGASYESQTLTITATSSNPGLVPNPAVTYTSPNTTGSLNLTPAADANGTATITVTVNDGQAQNNTVVRTFNVTVNAVNDAPTLNPLGNLTIAENAGQQTVNLSGIGTGATNELQTLVVTATSSNPGLVPNPTVSYSSPNTTGSLSFAPVTDANGTATITVTVNDGQVQNNTVVRTFTVTVNAVNNPPTLNVVNNVTVDEDSGVQTVSLSGIGSGAANESQTLVVTATSSNPSLIPSPTVTYFSPDSTGSLVFTPATNANGTATITVTVNDGQAANNTISRSFTVTVSPVNDSPTLNTIANVTVNEDAGAQTVNLSGIGTGAANETQTLTVTATSSNPALIPNPAVNYVSANNTGSLSFTPVANANGTATITVTVNDGQLQNNTVVRTFTVTVNEVNDAPTLNTLSNLSIAENAAQQTVNLSGISSGAANELQTLVVTATSSDPSLIPNPTVNYVSPNATGTLNFTPVTDANGTATITVTVNDGQTANNTIVRTFTVTVNGVNNVPTLDALSNVTINEDAGAQTVNLTGIGTGAANETQTLTVTAASSNPSLIPNPAVTYISPNATGSLAFTPVADASGTATISVTVNDGQAQNNTVVRTFTVTVNPINDAPTLNALNNLNIADNAGLQTVNLAGISSGAANESQTLLVTATSSNPGLIPNPTVNYVSPGANGSLSFTPVLGGSGTATITVTVNDGQAQNNTVVRTFIVSVNAVNIAPTLNTIASINLNEDAAAQTVNLAGIGSGASYESQTLTVTASSSNPGLIPQPTVNYSSPNMTGTLNFTPVANANGVATITVTVNDGQAQNSTITRTFTVTVNAVNDAPTLNTLTDLTLDEDAGAQTVNLSGITSGATNEAQTLIVTATSSTPALIPNPTVNYASPNTTGTLTFTPVATANGSAIITVTVNDGQAQNNTVVRTFTVTVNGVNNPPTLNGPANVTINEDAGSQTVNLSGIGSGAANELQTLTITATSSNPGLIPNPTVNYSSPSATGSLTFTPVANANGSATITVTINDGQSENNTLARTFTVTVNSLNDAPTLDTIAGLSFGGPSPSAMLPKTVPLTGIGSGATNENQTITVTASSSNPTIVPHPTVNYTSPNSSGTLTVAPSGDVSGTAVITVMVDDGQAQNNIVTRTFSVTVNAQNGTPAISAIANQTTVMGTPTPAIPFVIGDGETPAGSLTLTASSSNLTLVTLTNIVFGGSESNRTVTITPEPNQIGSADIAITVSDGVKVGQTVFRLDVVQPTPASMMTLVTNGTGTITGGPVTSPNQLGNQLYSLTAVSGAGQMFTGWTGSTNSASPKITFALRSNLVFRANFAPLNLTVKGKGSISPNLKAQSNLVAGQVYSITAVPAPGQIFSGWSGSSASTLPTLQFTMTPETALQANFISDPYYSAAGTYTGLFYEDDEVRQHSSGYFVALANDRGGYSGWVQIGGERRSFSGKLSPDCSGTNSLGKGLVLEFHCAEQTNRVTGRLVGKDFVSTLVGDRVVYHQYNPTPAAGNYTMAIPGQLGSTTSPAGDGIAFLQVVPAGIGYISATMGDGTVMTHAAFVSQDGNLPLYSPLYAGNGSVLGWLSLSNRPTDDISGAVNWIKPATPSDTYFKNGFTNQSFAFGSRYVAQTFLSLTNGTLSFNGGNLAHDFSNEIKLGYGRISNLSSNGLTMWTYPEYGVYSGYVYEPNAPTYRAFMGVFLQKQNMGRGFMFGTNQTSQVILTPSGALSINSAAR